MKRLLAGIVLSAACAVGQDAVSPKPNDANGGDAPYTNECLALAYRPLDGWNFAQMKASHQSNQMTLFKVQKHSAAGPAESLELDVLQTPTLKHPNMERFTILLALSLVHVDASKNKITKNAYPVSIAGRSFFRSDMSQGDRALSLFTTWYRGYAMVAWASADSPQNIEDAADALRVLSFSEDKRTAECFSPQNQ